MRKRRLPYICTYVLHLVIKTTEDNMNESPLRDIFKGTKGTVLFWVLVVLAGVFLLKILPSLISIALKLAIFAVIAYVLIKALGKR